MGNFLRQLLKFPAPSTDKIHRGYSKKDHHGQEKQKTRIGEGHLFVAAIRILENRNSAPPDLNQIAELVGFSPEQTGLISRRLHEAGIVRIVQGAFGDRWGIEDHHKTGRAAPIR